MKEEKKQPAMVKELSNLFNEYEPETEREIIDESDYKLFVEPNQVVGITPKTQQALQAIKANFHVEELPFPVKLYEKITKEASLAGTEINSQFAELIIRLLRIEKRIKIYTVKNSPAIFENKHFLVFIAPMIEED